MIRFDKTDIQRCAVSAVGAIALAAASIGAAVGPARAAAPAPATAAAWQDDVERRLSTVNDTAAVKLPGGTSREATLALRFTADGDFAGAGIARSSGDAALDRHALAVARHLDYPRLPLTMRGKPQQVAMRLVFGVANTAEEYAAMQAAVGRSPRPVEPAHLAAR